MTTALPTSAAWIDTGQALLHVDTESVADLPPAVSARADAWRALMGDDLQGALRDARSRLQRARASADPQRLASALDRLDALLAGAVALADLPRAAEALAQLPADRVEPWPLLQAAWESVRPAAALRGVQARFRPHGDPAALGAVYGSEPWLRRLLVECLESAMHHTPRGGTLDIEHCQSGPRALVILHGTRAFAEASDGAAHALAQRIAEMHGGAITIENDANEQRALMIDLPTGAPFHSGHGSIDLAQAERFAHDFSALRERARQRADAATDSRRTELPAGEHP